VTEKDGTAHSSALALLNLRLRADKLDLASVLTKAGTAPASDMKVDVEVTVDSKGHTPDQLLSDLSGEASVSSEGGKILEGHLNRLVQDVDPLRFLLPFWRKADVVNVRCLVGSAEIKQGIADTNMMFDTEHMTVLGKGTVNLRDRQINLALDPKPKSSALSATGVPVVVTGPLGSPKVEPRTKEAVGGLVKSVLGGLVVPLNQLSRVFGSQARDACASAVRP
jgi:uncharacterized protein involved in outer membrane biogenesis